MRVGRYSPVRGSALDSDIPFFDSGKSQPSLQQNATSRFSTRWIRRKWKTLTSTCLVFLCLVYLARRPTRPREGLAHVNYSAVEWSNFAYSQYATDEAYLCNSLMVFEALQRLGSRADRILFYPQTWDLNVADRWDRSSQLLVLARDKFKVKLMPVDIPTSRSISEARKSGGDTWDRSVAKLLAFGETQYQRILHIDNDVTIYKHLDELFLLPPARVAMPRAYWSEQKPRPLTSLLVLVEPSVTEFQGLINDSWKVAAGSNKYDMELLNDRYGESALVLPHRPFLITGELRKRDHEAYLGNDYEVWNPHQVISQASLVHFSDWPLPKPWIMWPNEGMRTLRPKCRTNPGTVQESGCDERDIWMGLYDDFRKRRKEVCKLLSVPAPRWPPKGVNMTSFN